MTSAFTFVVLPAVELIFTAVAPAVTSSLAVGPVRPMPSRLLVLSQKKLLSPATVPAPVQNVACPAAPLPVMPLPPPPLTVPLQARLPEPSTVQPVEPEPPARLSVVAEA